LHKELQESALLELLSSQSSLVARKPSPQTAVAGGEPLGAIGMHCARASPPPKPPEPLTPLDAPLAPPVPDEPPLALAGTILNTFVLVRENV